MFEFSEKDSCGVGFIASRNIPPTHGMTLKVLECLANLDHRGAKFADGTGDGAGVLTEIPFELIRAEFAELSIEHDTNKKIGTISCFPQMNLPPMSGSLGQLCFNWPCLGDTSMI